MTVIYLYDVEGWALHALGTWLKESLAPSADIRLMTAAAWHASPERADVLYLSYSGLIAPGFDYRRWADRVVTTIHDPCEISFFEHRDDWADLPLQRLELAQVDACSVISEELRDVLRARRLAIGDIPVTPTWSPRCEALRSARTEHSSNVLRAMSSTNVPVRRPLREILRRVRHPRPFLVDETGSFSLGQLSSLPVRRRRKRVEWLTAIARSLRDRTDIQCDFRAGKGAMRSPAEYEAALLASDVYLCTSTMEGGPLPVLEAVMAGAAVLSTRVGQVPRWIEDNGSGFLCASLDEFTTRLRQYADDGELLRRHQARARAIADALVPDLSGWRTLLSIG